MTLPSDLSKLLGNGENPNGMIAQTANGTIRNGRGGDGDEYRYGMMADGPRWNTDPRPEAPQPFGIEIAIPRGHVRVGSHTRKKPR